MATRLKIAGKTCPSDVVENGVGLTQDAKIEIGPEMRTATLVKWHDGDPSGSDILVDLMTALRFVRQGYIKPTLFANRYVAIN
ncbi:hypothetical protein GR157_24415 [Burkholderia sp. 4701]|nr:hypothetical protein [Burkholderia sp. 4701]MXN85106.1 hypothetical protein [Burkholderia sp. 4812]